MATTNKDRISRSLDLLRDGLSPFVEREFEARLGSDWQERVNQSRRFDIPTDENGSFVWDSLSLLRSMFKFWNEVFKYPLGHSERSFVSELMTIRNDFAHEKQFGSDDTYRALDTTGRLLVAVSAMTEAEAIDAMRQELLRCVYAESCDQADTLSSTRIRRGLGEKEHNRGVVAVGAGTDVGAELEVGVNPRQHFDGLRTTRDAIAAPLGVMGEVSMPPSSIAPPRAGAFDERRSPRHTSRGWAVPAAALIAALVVGLISGFAWQGVGFASETLLAGGPTAIKEHWLHEVADYYLIFAEDDSRVVELGPERKDFLEKWLGKRLGHRLPVADLSRYGSQFKGGRLIPLEGQAAALFVYQLEGGELFSVCITRAWSKGERERIAARKSGLEMVYWSHAGLAYVVMGHMDPTLLDSIAKDLEKHFEKA